MPANRIFPTNNDVAQVAGDGRIFTEKNVADWMGAFTDLNDWVVSGLEPSNPSGLQLTISAGKAFVKGYLLDEEQQTIVLTDNVTQGIYLQLTRDAGGNVDGSQLLQSPTLVPGVADSVLLAVVTTSGGTITSLDDERRWQHGAFAGTYIGDGNTSRDFNLFRTPVMVFVTGDTGDGRTFACSGIKPAGFRRTGGFPESLPGFWIYDADDVVRQIPKALTASTTWNIPFTAADSSVTTTVAVAGSLVGNSVSVSHDAVGGAASDQLEGEVTQNGTVTVTYTTVGTASTPGSGTLKVAVHQAKTETLTLPGRDCNYDSRFTGENVPYIINKGFRVSVGAGDRDLNTSGVLYRYLAIM